MLVALELLVKVILVEQIILRLHLEEAVEGLVQLAQLPMLVQLEAVLVEQEQHLPLQAHL